jgi:prophage DNA circulation protein
MAIADVLPASFRGVPFAVRSSPTQGGRRQAIHEYPGKDGVFPEDMGRRGRRYTIRGFIVSNSVVYGGGDVAIQRQLLTAALEASGSGPLVHPTYGVVTVSVDAWSISDDLDAGTRADIELNFIESTQQSFLGISASTISQVLSAAVLVDAAAATAFTVASVTGLSGASASAQWSAAVTAGGQDATALTNLASQLPGPYGRYFAGGNSGYLSSGSGSVYAGDTTVSDLVSAAATARATLTQAAKVVAADFAALTTISAAQAATDVQALVAALLAACADPADAIRILSGLAAFAPFGAVTGVSDLYRRAAVVATARAATTYQPSSQDDAALVQMAVTGLIDNEVTIAGDEGDDATYQAFKALRVAAVADLQKRGAALAALKTFGFGASLPALYLAEKLYGDGTRADQLIAEANPVHPLFMPTSFQALAA